MNYELLEDEGVLLELHDIQKTTGTNAKIDKLVEISKKNNVTMLKALEVIVSPHITTNIGEKKFNKVNVPECKQCGGNCISHKETLVTLLDFLSKESTGTTDDVVRCKKYLRRIKDETAKEVLVNIICQTISLGVDAKTVNKAWKKSFGIDFLKIYTPMLAMQYNKMTDKDREHSYSITEKLDGVRMLVMVQSNGRKTAFSKNGKVLDSTYNEFLDNLVLPFGWVYDGELLPSGGSQMTNKEQYKAISKITRTKGLKDPNKMIYQVFDMIPLTEYCDELEVTPYSERREALSNIESNQYQHVVDVIGVVNNLSSDNNIKYVIEKLNDFIEAGKEGLMLNKLDGKYSHKRCRAIFKMKALNTCDLMVVDVNEGTGRNKGKLGALVCEYKGSTVNVGTGFTDKQRDEFWELKDDLIGKIVEIEYTEESEDKNGVKSLRFPRFIHIRFDKNKNEISYE